MRLLALERWTTLLGGTIVTLALLAPLSCWATLGDNAASVLADQAQMKGTVTSVDNRTYVLHEITAPSGAKVREYVSPAGTVFAVTWEGQFPPDFQLLLGPYYQQVQQAIAQQKSAEQSGDQQQSRRRRGPVSVQTAGIVFSQSGHQRSFHGQAYIPQLVPQGVQTSDIR
jgi:hypothetical protein